jgi:hypothetical protein
VYNDGAVVPGDELKAGAMSRTDPPSVKVLVRDAGCHEIS